MTEHDLRSEADRFWPSSAEQQVINEHRVKPLDLARIKRWDNAFWAVAIPVGAAAIILASLLWGA